MNSRRYNIYIYDAYLYEHSNNNNNKKIKRRRTATKKQRQQNSMNFKICLSSFTIYSLYGVGFCFLLLFAWNHSYYLCTFLIFFFSFIRLCIHHHHHFTVDLCVCWRMHVYVLMSNFEKKIIWRNFDLLLSAKNYVL